MQGTPKKGRRFGGNASHQRLMMANLVSSLGVVVLSAGVLLFLVDAFTARRRRTPAGDDPWGGFSLEWATTSPPPENNFSSLPRIRSERPAFDMRHPELAPGSNVTTTEEPS